MQPPALWSSSICGHIEQIVSRHGGSGHSLPTEEANRGPGLIWALMCLMKQLIDPALRVLRSQTRKGLTLLDFPVHQSLQDLLLGLLVWKLTEVSHIV